MIKVFASFLALVVAAPVHALSIVSLHGGGGIVPSIGTSVEGVIIIGSVLLLAGVVTYRWFRCRA